MNTEHVEVVKQGDEVISRWRTTHPKAKLELGGADLRGVNLCKASLRWADLRGADLNGANLREADLYGVDLGEADLRWADLYGVDLSGADLSGADLSGANLNMANLCKANLRWTGGILAIGPGGSRKDMLYFIKHDNGPMVKTGCFWGTLLEFEAAVEKTHGNNEHGRYYRAVISLVKAWAAVTGELYEVQNKHQDM